jgi:hypothetical protein
MPEASAHRLARLKNLIFAPLLFIATCSVYEWTDITASSYANLNASKLGMSKSRAHRETLNLTHCDGCYWVILRRR